MELSPEERAILGGERGEAARRALAYQVEVGKFWGARRFLPVTNVHMMGDIEVMGDGGLQWLKEHAALGARCAVATTTNARCIDFGHCERLGRDRSEITVSWQRNVCIAPTAEEAQAEFAAGLGRRGIDLDAMSEDQRRALQGLVLVGDPDTVGEQLATDLAMGVDGFTINQSFNGHVPDRVALLGEVASKVVA